LFNHGGSIKTAYKTFIAVSRLTKKGFFVHNNSATTRNNSKWLFLKNSIYGTYPVVVLTQLKFLYSALKILMYRSSIFHKDGLCTSHMHDTDIGRCLYRRQKIKLSLF